VFPARPSRIAARRVAVGHLTGVQRLLFVLALFTFGVSTMYTGTALLARIYPALFPGKNLSDLTSIGGFKGLSQLPGITEPGAESSFTQRINLLIMGLDRRPVEGEIDGRTDTLMVATIDPITKTMSMLSFPRDMVIDVNRPDGSTSETRINESFEFGVSNSKSTDASERSDDGAKQLELDIQKNFGIDIDYYVLMDFSGVEKLVDAVGGRHHHPGRTQRLLDLQRRRPERTDGELPRISGMSTAPPSRRISPRKHARLSAAAEVHLRPQQDVLPRRSREWQGDRLDLPLGRCVGRLLGPRERWLLDQPGVHEGRLFAVERRDPERLRR
jgi:LCP family protein required for cell wall assembly